MRRAWLLFAQTVTIAIALLFVVATLKPEWLDRAPSALLPNAAKPFAATFRAYLYDGTVAPETKMAMGVRIAPRCSARRSSRPRRRTW